MPATALAPGTAIYPHDVLWDALREVEDPEMGVSIVDLGLVISLTSADGHVAVQITYTAMGCPATYMIEEDVQTRLLRVPGIYNVRIETVWEPVWTKARLTAEGRDALQLLGVAI